MSHDARALVSIAKSTRLTAFDVGARGGLKHDLLPLAAAVDYTLFEPDNEEFKRLEQSNQFGHWCSVTLINEALDEKNGSFELNLYRQRGCSSYFSASRKVGELFSRGDYYIHDGVVNVSARRLDDLVAEQRVRPPHFIKIDVQGMEVAVFNGAPKALAEDVVGIRVEVSFFPIYSGQPLFAEVDQKLRPFGFVPMRFMELHEWRRRTRVKYPGAAKDAIPVSYGQMMHGDILYLLHPEELASDSDEQIERLVRLGVVSASCGHFDHALAAFTRPRVEEFLRDRTGVDAVQAIVSMSRRFVSGARIERLARALSRFGSRIFSN